MIRVPPEPVWLRRLTSVTVAVIVRLRLIGRRCVLISSLWAPHPAAATAVPIGALYGSPAQIGRLLFREFLLPFEITSVLILIAIMGAVLLARRPEGEQSGHHPTAEETGELLDEAGTHGSAERARELALQERSR